MLCDEFRCLYADGDICKPVNDVCVADQCDCWGACETCRDVGLNPCKGIRREWEVLTGER